MIINKFKISILNKQNSQLKYILQCFSLSILVIISSLLFNLQAFSALNSGKFIELGKSIYNHGQVNLTKLKNGKILISEFEILGDNGKEIEEKDKYLKKFELYNPVTKKFEPMAQPIYFHSNSQPIVLDDGNVLIVGNTCGKANTEFEKKKCNESEYTEIYDPEKNEFKLAEKMKIPRIGYGIAKLQDGRVLITNGLSFSKDNYLVNKYNNSIEFIPQSELRAEIFDPKTETFSLTGNSSINAIKETYDPSGNNKIFKKLSNINRQTITLDNGEILVLWINEGLAEIYNPETNKFRTVGKMVMKRNFPKVIKLNDGRVLILSGESPKEAWRTAEIFDPKLEMFKNLGNMAADHGIFGSAKVISLKDGRVMISEGTTDNNNYPYRFIYLRHIEIFDPKTDTFKYIGEKNTQNIGGYSILLDDGNVFFLSNCKKYKYKHTCGELYIPNYK